ncbi:ABC transporter ATP-binding protein [uncultured Acetatifactor sp.]|uniref:ATP-binding cassette domain-containing protein n=1 Tax=uncultured Acetatifactor sp. TaxID=1671927 RepID=UPI002627B138|nr:ABC transporter ATP-binding protein [uncultured Acetatifactor sp.]MCI9652429.1 ABC transporter ATP-binding protein [Lachnospiraceae bacterium]
MKKDGLSIGAIIKNNFYMAAAVFRADAAYLGLALLVRALSAIAESFLYVYLLGTVIYFVENGKGAGTILLFLLSGMAFLGAVFALQSYYKHVFEPVHRERIVSGLQQALFDKLQAADMANYDSEELYTAVALANREIAVRPLEATDNLFRGFEGLVAAGAIMAGTVPTNGFVPGICIISFAAGIFLTNVQSEKEVGYDEEMKKKDKKLSMLRRLLYLPEYGKDNRLSHVHKVFLRDYRATVEEKEGIGLDSGRKIGNLAFLRRMFCSAFCIDFLIPLYLSMAALLWGKLPISAFVVAVNAGDQIQRKHQVFFAYPDGTPGLQGIDLAIRKGSKVAIVGRNGSGKSTLIKLLLRFYDASSGSIRQNGRDIREFAVSSYRAQFGAVFQDFNIYAASVRDNVCMGEEAEEGRLVRALGRAGWYGGVKEFGGGCCRDGGKEYGEGCGRAYGEGGVPELELQLTRELDEEGVLFSGGQLQRLALARAFYKDSDIVIMDEPTAAMDVFFEREFYRTVFRQLKDKTVIFVSHRLSSVTACDTIVYMERGRILEQGTHDYLMGLQGGYYRLFRAQFE